MPGTEQEWSQLSTSALNDRRLPRFIDTPKVTPKKDDEVNHPKHYNTKRCGSCKEELPLSAFAKNRAKKDGLQERCRACRAAHYVNSGYSSTVYWKNILRKYNVGVDEYERLAKEQDYRCAICKISFEDSMLVVDHCHETGKVRGLLCSPCNRGLGFFRDEAENLQTAADYVNRFS